MKHIYYYRHKCNVRQLSSTEAMMFDMFDAVVDMYVDVKHIEVTPDEIEIMFEATDEAIASCERNGYEVALFLDDIVKVFEGIKKYHQHFPLKVSYDSLQELKDEIRLYSRWVSDMLLDDNTSQITKQNYLNLRSL